MRLIGVACLLGGWLVAVGGLLITSSLGGRLVLSIAGIALSLYGGLGVLNGYYVERAIWKK